MDDEYVVAVLEVVEQIPPGQATTYGHIASIVGEELGRGGPRQVGAVLARYGGQVPWWRVVNAAGCPPAHEASIAIEHLMAEHCPMAPGNERVRLSSAMWLGGA